MLFILVGSVGYSLYIPSVSSEPIGVTTTSPQEVRPCLSSAFLRSSTEGRFLSRYEYFFLRSRSFSFIGIIISCLRNLQDDGHCCLLEIVVLDRDLKEGYLYLKEPDDFGH